MPVSEPVSMPVSKPTVWILGDQLDRKRGALGRHEPGGCRVLLVESERLIASRPWHRQRLHLVLSSMAHLAAELRAEGFEVDERVAPNLEAGLREHLVAYDVDHVVASEPMSWDATRLLQRLGVELVPSERFLCSYQSFAEWAQDRRQLKLEDFYRWQRSRLGILLEDGPDGPTPSGGEWNFDHLNREPPPRDGRAWPAIQRFELDAIDHRVIDRLPPTTVGAEPTGWWPVTRAQALTRLDEFVESGLAPFGAHEDAMLAGEWKLAHSVLASSLNQGLLHPSEVVDAAVAAYEDGRAPINSVEGFVRQVIGWREYVWGVYWLWMPEYRRLNALEAARPVPPAFTGAPTDMGCVSTVAGRLHDHGYVHHIERLMVLGNLALTSGVDPWSMTEWMWATFVDAAEWVMLPNVMGMALFADGGRMATKPYASGGAYLNRMSDHCRTCRFDPRKRVGDDACPFTTLYWDFLARNGEALRGNHRMSRPLAAMRKLDNLADVRVRAADVLARLDAGEL